ncbi:alpha/beta hydrolase family protein [Actinoallomurus vinaceus]|uniref:Alpha/beta hydrolase family protein n=1 Tax=Actinoallomurus vinaceus TaxID=1080074 RepID=A0ABP8UA94_9ACTN
MVAGGFTRGFTGVLLTVVASVCVLPETAGAAVKRVAADDGAKITGEHWIDARTVDLTVSSPALGASVPVRVLVPRGWSRSARKSWPVVYAYHGGRDTYVSWTRSTDIAKVAASWDVMVVMPDTGWAGWFTDWWNGGKRGKPKWETFHTSELLQLMQRNYRAGTRRATMGVSSSGYGAVKYAARHPGMFKYAVSLSGVLHLTQTGVPALVMFEASEKYDPFRIWGIPGIDDKNWKANDPYVLAAKLKGTGLYLASGLTGLPGPNDPTGGKEPVELQEVVCGATTVSLVNRLRKLHIPVTAHIYQKGYHDWSTWQPEMHTAWPLMMKALTAKKLG